MDPDTDRRIGAIEAKQQARDALCRACLDRLRRREEVTLAREVRLWAAVAMVLAAVCAVLVLV